ncbi:hypothetical protein BJY04DRAFT_225250 [Aspergillus karnatakaensis]|uniref:uncharacterized protein n=1 Tax=Aspergillus karnatakaensis TaxID=1810916 RepID=UPI003CCD70F7
MSKGHKCIRCKTGQHTSNLSAVVEDGELTSTQVKNPPGPEEGYGTVSSVKYSKILPPASEQGKAREPSPEEIQNAIETAIRQGSHGPANSCRIDKFDQPTASSYGGKPVKIYIGRSAPYFVPENIASQIGSLQQHLDRGDLQSPDMWDDHIFTARFPKLDDDIAHTFIHYLYTGDYQTLKPSSTSDMPWHAIEYKRSVLAYHAGLHCGLPGLAEHGKMHMQVFDKAIPIFEIISLGRKHLPRVNTDTWSFQYLTRRILASFEADETLFKQDKFFDGFGKAPVFDMFLGKVMAVAYTRKIWTMRAAYDANRPENRARSRIALSGVHFGKKSDLARIEAEKCSAKPWPHLQLQKGASPAFGFRADDLLKRDGDSDENKSFSPGVWTPFSSPNSAAAKSGSEFETV